MKQNADRVVGMVFNEFRSFFFDMRKKAIRILLFATVVLFPAQVLATPPLYVPWKCGERYEITQGNNDNFSHSNVYAWDIGMDEGTEIHAPAAGTIQYVFDSSDQNCKELNCDDNYAMNRIIMYFDEGNAAAFYHLKFKGAAVSVGQHVNRGDLIGYSGATGNAKGAHLHYQIQEICNSWYCNTIPSSWVDFGVPTTGQQITSNNCTCTPTTEVCNQKDDDCDGEVDEDCDEPGDDPAVEPDDSETQISADDDCGCRVSSNAPTPSGLSLLMGLLAGIGLFGLRRRKEN